jgi:hypothetical protein
LHDLVSYTEKLDALLHIRQPMSTLANEGNDSISSGPAMGDATRSIGNHDDEASRQLDDEGTIFGGLAVRGEKDGVRELGHGLSTSGDRVLFSRRHKFPMTR